MIVPDHKKPGEVRDLHFKYCGQKLKKSSEFTEFVEKDVPAKFQDRFNKSEKGIDIEICCDAFRLAAAGRLDRLFLFTNDDDFIPFCRTIKEYGSYISIIHLTDIVPPNVSLLHEADSYDVVAEEQLQQMFLPLVDPAAPPIPPPPEEATSPSVLKVDAPPSDMIVDGLAPAILESLEGTEADESEAED